MRRHRTSRRRVDVGGHGCAAECATREVPTKFRKTLRCFVVDSSTPDASAVVERRAGVLSARPPTGKSATPDGGRKACEGVQRASRGQERALGVNVDARVDGRWTGGGRAVDGRGGVGAVEEVWNKEAARGSAWEKRNAAREAQFSLTATSVGLGFRGKRLVVWKRLARLSLHYLSLATPGPPMRGAHQQGVHHHVTRIQHLSARNWPTCQCCQCCHRPLLTGARPISAGGSCQLASSVMSCRPLRNRCSQPGAWRGSVPPPSPPPPPPHRSQVPFADQHRLPDRATIKI